MPRTARALPTKPVMPAAGSRESPDATPPRGGRPGKNERPHTTDRPNAGHTPSIIMSPDPASSADPDKAGRRHARCLGHRNLEPAGAHMT